jgi:hypothetical protein
MFVLILSTCSLACSPTTPPDTLDFIDAVKRGWTYTATEGRLDMGGPLALSVTSAGADVHLLIDAGTTFLGPDDIQPAVITEDMLVFIPAGSTEELLLPSACGSADAMGASEGMVYDAGVSKLSDELGQVLDRINAELSPMDNTAQEVIWVYTDDHDFSSVFVPAAEERTLLNIFEEEVEGFEDPGYAVRYREPDPDEGTRFSGEAMEARCSFPVDAPRAMDCRVVLEQPDGETFTLIDDLDVGSGFRIYTLTVGLEGYPPGTYQMRLEGKRFGNVIVSREMRLQG